MSQELTKQQQSVALSKDMFPDDVEMQKMWMMANAYSQTPLVCPAARGNPASCFYILSLGKELGISFTHALRSTYITPDGKLGIEGNIIASLLWSKGFKIDIIESTASRAEVKITRPDNSSHTDSFTIEEAATAGLTKRFKDGQWRDDFSWKAYPKDKLYWRALMRTARRVATDVLFGLYLREELEEAQAAEVDFDQTTNGADPEGIGDYIVEQINPDKIERQNMGVVVPPEPAKPESPKPEPPKSEPTLDEKLEASRALAEIEWKKVRDEIVRIVGGVTKVQFDDYYMGWFGAKDKRGLPRVVSSYLLPAQSLLTILGKLPETHQWLIEKPRELGVETKKQYEVLAAGEPRNHTAKPEPSPLKDDDVFDDPLLTHFKWTSMETAIWARALMVKWSFDINGFEDHLKFLKLTDLPEHDLLALIKLLMHDSPAAYKAWKIGLDKNIPLSVVLGRIETKLGTPVGMSEESTPLVKNAMAVVIGEL